MTRRVQRSATALAAVIAIAYAGASDAQDTTRSGDAANRDTRAQQSGAQQAAQPKPGAQQAMRDVRLSQLVGMNVRNAQGRDLGEINDLVIDVASGRIQYAVLGFGGFLGLGEKLFAFPMSAFRVVTDRDAPVATAPRAVQPGVAGAGTMATPGAAGTAPGTAAGTAAGTAGTAAGTAATTPRTVARSPLTDVHLVLNVPEARLRDAPGFDNDRWPDFNDPAYRGEVDKFAAVNQQRGSVDRNVNLRRASALLDADVHDRQDNDIGDIEDVVVNLQNGQVRYVVVDFEPGWFQPDRLVVVPMNALRPKVDRNDADLVFSGDQQRLAKAPTIESNTWPDLNTAGFRNTVDRWVAGWRNGTPGTAATGARDAQGVTRGAATGAGVAGDSATGNAAGSPR